jgi:protein SCO1/2
MRLKLSLVVAGLAFSLAAWGQSGSQASVDSTAVAATPSIDVKKVHIDQLLGHQVPMTTEFKDWDGSNIAIGKLLGIRPAILVPIFYNCTGVCNIELQNLLTTIQSMKARKIGVDYDVIVLSINPTEGPDLAAGKRKNVLNSINMAGSEKGWHFLTGSMPNIRAVTDSVGFQYTYDAEKNVVSHPSGIMVLSPAGQVSSYLYGANYDVPVVQNDLDVAKKGRIGIKTPEVFFGCIHIDPVTGQRSLVIENVLRVMGVITVLVLIGSILTLSGKKIVRR